MTLFGRDSENGNGNGNGNRNRDGTEADFGAARDRMVDSLLGAGRIEREETIEALRAVPRHEFVPESRRETAYADRPLPIGAGQTISAPHMVGIICDHLELEAGDSVLEVGTGCGYHAAVTAEIVGAGNVYSVEYVESLAAEARERLERLGYGGVHVRVGDGAEGWAENAPYDAAYLTCAAPDLPDPVVEQLRVGGRLVAPVGTGRQTLVRAEKADDGLDRERHGAVRFVTMQGE
ncbi:protein-L-isoaspartate O-methyltransferase [Natronomonas sp. F2-12]|uniref:Protein-L-isoaspartate O-methyltransferase n=1 Tax=Natronomonas aquatica TaxID=2841590 RepID=A0A9R1CVV0_9EURY|nr:protein-L-isoaspartate O-methyltransferase [Natronomonas aquatica]MCQ4334441.1 protein-L-isoaspartate O-methyltransferase [Natronomonas aquatica]